MRAHRDHRLIDYARVMGVDRTLEDQHRLILRDKALAAAAPAPPAVQSALRTLLEANRHLDRGNAHCGNLCADFFRFGVALADEMANQYPRRYSGCTDKLDLLNRARNAIAHSESVAFAESEAEQPLTLGTVRS